jgi:hypothetical protein
MSNDDDGEQAETAIATETMLNERLRYRWHAGYDRSEEPSDVPNWTIVRESVEDDESGVTTFQHRYDPEHIWISSNVTYTLTETI